MSIAHLRKLKGHTFKAKGNRNNRGKTKNFTNRGDRTPTEI